MSELARREFLWTAFAAWAAEAAAGEEKLAFADTRPFNAERPLMPWEKLESWITPTDHLFRVGHYGFSEVDAVTWKLQVAGLVDRPKTFTLDDLKKRKVREQVVTIECSGNGAAGGLIGNVKWKGTALAPILKECGVKPEGIEVVFFAADSGTEKIRGADYKQNFARALAIKDAMHDNILLCWEMNGAALDKNHGAPVRLIVPGWYGVAWVKWLTRIEVHDRAFLGRFMGRDYVTIRGEKKGEETVWRETSVGRMNLKSVPAHVVKRGDGSLQVMGAAWSDGTPLEKVEVRIDDGVWQPAAIAKENRAPYCWMFWTYEWKGAAPGEHTVASRAVDSKGRVQPAPDDPFITLKKTYWEANQQAVRKIKI